MFLYCYNHRDYIFVFLRYDPAEDNWTELTPMSVARVLAGSVVHHGKIYVIGRITLLNSVNIIIVSSYRVHDHVCGRGVTVTGLKSLNILQVKGCGFEP